MESYDGWLAPSISANGAWIVFNSVVDLVVGDTNGVADVFAARNPLTLAP